MIPGGLFLGWGVGGGLMQGRSFPFQKLVPKLNVRHLYRWGLLSEFYGILTFLKQMRIHDSSLMGQS